MSEDIRENPEPDDLRDLRDGKETFPSGGDDAGDRAPEDVLADEEESRAIREAFAADLSDEDDRDRDDREEDDRGENLSGPRDAAPREERPVGFRDETPLEKEYREYLEFVAERTQSVPGAELARSLSPTLTPPEILRSWELIGEAGEVLFAGGMPPLEKHLDLTPMLDELMIEGASLNVESLLLVKDEAEAAENSKKRFAGFGEKAPLLFAETQRMGDYSEFAKTVARSVSDEGDVLDTASDELASIRREMAAARTRITEKLATIMRSEEYKPLVRDEIVTVRKDRYVIPVRSSAAGKNRGLVHDWSQSGQTAYMEPLETVDENNHLNYLKKREKVEIERILKKLSRMASDIAPSLKESVRILTKLDLYLTLGKISLDLDTAPPAYRPGEGYDLKGLRHPLLERRLASENRRMTPLDFKIEPENPLLVISGLNTGGKTVALKTLGLNLLMMKSGLHAHGKANGSTDFPAEILCVMGDNQDLSSDLSTFSGHLRALARVLERPGPGVLVLLDELGGGTDPQEGQALALAVLEHLKTTGATVLAATHFHLLKTWAALTPGVVSVAVNSSVDGTPAYGLSYGAPGFSGGLNMARKLGLPSFLVDKAFGYLDDNHKKSMKLLEELDETRSALLAEKAAVEKERLELRLLLEHNKAKLAKEINKLNLDAKEKDFRLKNALSRVKTDFERLKTEVAEKLRGGERPNPVDLNVKKAEFLKTLKEVLPETIKDDGEIKEAPRDLKPDDEVYIKKFRKYGKVLSWNREKNEGSVESGMLTVKVTLDELGAGRDASANKKDSPRKSRVRVTLSPEESRFSSISLLGRTVDEARDAIDKEIDKALLDGRSHL
ncbi:MAG: hypothetical protein LBF41_00185, partial [Deltaproteobacteria bacterium]|nr:hypothetical protein [Deltaproteobacteria bacterium]